MGNIIGNHLGQVCEPVLNAIAAISNGLSVLTTLLTYMTPDRATCSNFFVWQCVARAVSLLLEPQSRCHAAISVCVGILVGFYLKYGPNRLVIHNPYLFAANLLVDIALSN